MKKLHQTNTIDFTSDASSMAKAMHDIVIAKFPSIPMVIDGKVVRPTVKESAFIPEKVFLESWCKVLVALRDENGFDLSIETVNKLLGIELLTKLCGPGGILETDPAAIALYCEIMGDKTAAQHERELEFGYKTMMICRALQSYQDFPECVF